MKSIRRYGGRHHRATAPAVVSTHARDHYPGRHNTPDGRALAGDAGNRPVEAKGNNGNSLIRYEYDGLTRRVQEGATHQYFSAGWQVLEERNGANQTTVSYAWSPVYVDAMIARDLGTNANGSLDERLYVLQDANFNVTAIAVDWTRPAFAQP